MPLSAGTAVNTVTGSVALQDLDGAGTLRYLPVANVTPSISRGDSLMPMVNNAAFAANKVKGTALGDVSIDTFLFAGLMNAAFFNHAVGSGAGDTGGAGYSVLTVRSNNQGGPGPETYARAKCAALSGSMRFSTNGAAQAVRLSMRYTSADPQSGSVTALAAPAAGALSTSGILGYAQSAITGATDVVAVSFNLDTGLSIIPGNVAGSNPAYSSLSKGLMQTMLGGTVTITQIKGTGTVPGANGADCTLTVSLGSAGAGVSFQFSLMPMSVSLPVDIGIGYQSVTLALKSVDGTTVPFLATDL